MKRLITFGCSFTDYAWPTWSDIIALDQDCEYENWAMGGGGNQQIARRILYRDQQCGWRDDDTVMVQWTSITREDRFHDTQWISQGSVSMAPHYGKSWINKYWCWNNDVINTAQARLSTEAILRHRLKYQMAMTWGDGDDLPVDDNKITNFWRSRLTPCDTLPNHAEPFHGQGSDGHPDPRWWLNWIETKIYPLWGLTVKHTTREKVDDIQRYLESLVHKRVPQHELQQLADEYTKKTSWRTNKIKPGGNSLKPLTVLM